MKLVDIEHLSKVFEGRRVLNDISFTVQSGEVFGYLGPNGAGKTTTMRILLGLLRPTSGSALVNGSDLATDDEARASIGILLENDGLYDRMTAWQNLDYYGRLYRVGERERRITELLISFGLNERRGDKVFTFSKGMRRKLGIARAIIHQPEILVLDEPTSGLDPEAQKMVRDILTDMARDENLTVLLSSHNLDEVQKTCTKVAVLKDGSIRAFDTVAGLREGRENRVLTITLSRESDALMAVNLIREVPWVREAHASGTVVNVNHEGESTAPLIQALCGRGIGVEEARRSVRSLEDVYIDLVKGEERKV
jgi:ABC-2 type transport system ATP-binding protein